EMLARFSHEITEAGEHLVTHAVPVRHPPFFDHLADTWIQVFAITLEREVKRHVVDPGAGVIDLLDRHADVSGKLGRRALNAVAQAHRPDAADAVDGPAVHRHRVDVI